MQTTQPLQQGGVKEKVRLRIKLCKTSVPHAKMRAQSPFNDSSVKKKQEILKKNPTGKVICGQRGNGEDFIL